MCVWKQKEFVSIQCSFNTNLNYILITLMYELLFVFKYVKFLSKIYVQFIEHSFMIFFWLIIFCSSLTICTFIIFAFRIPENVFNSLFIYKNFWTFPFSHSQGTVERIINKSKKFLSHKHADDYFSYKILHWKGISFCSSITLNYFAAFLQDMEM